VAVERPYIFVGLNMKVTGVILNQNFCQLYNKKNSRCLEEINILETSLNLYMPSDTKEFVSLK
jgi:hypothetical protein